MLANKDLHDHLTKLRFGKAPYVVRQQVEDCLAHRGIQLRQLGLWDLRHPSHWEHRAEETLGERRDEKVRTALALSWNFPSRNSILSRRLEDALTGTLETYAAFIPEQLDQLPVAVLIRPRRRLDLHYHRVVLPDPIV